MNASPETAKGAAGGMDSRPVGSPRVEAPTKSRDASAQSSSPRKRRVLIVDDEEKIIAALRRLLRREDYELVTANCGSEALTLLEADPVPLVISDYRMPGMTGVELLHEVRQRWPSTLRIILSGYSEVNTIIAAINEGEIYKFISKPWNDEEIKLHVRRALEQYELEEENERLGREIAAQNERLRELNTMLEQRVTDASTGLTSAQSLLENIGVGVLTVDRAGLVVGANRCANEIISSGRSELIGIPAKVAFPEALYKLACTAGIPDDGAASCHVQLGGKELQCRVNPLVASGGCRGRVIALWEEVG